MKKTFLIIFLFLILLLFNGCSSLWKVADEIEIPPKGMWNLLADDMEELRFRAQKADNFREMIELPYMASMMNLYVLKQKDGLFRDKVLLPSIINKDATFEQKSNWYYDFQLALKDIPKSPMLDLYKEYKSANKDIPPRVKLAKAKTLGDLGRDFMEGVFGNISNSFFGNGDKGNILNNLVDSGVNLFNKVGAHWWTGGGVAGISLLTWFLSYLRKRRKEKEEEEKIKKEEEKIRKEEEARDKRHAEFDEKYNKRMDELELKLEVKK